MRGLVRWTVLALPLSVAAWVGCSSKSDVIDAADAGADAPGDAAQGPPADTGVDAPPPRDCTNDVMSDGVWNHLECSGLYRYSEFQAKAVNTGIVPYKPGVEFWSDGAEKARFLYLPPGSKIDTSTFDEWKWPKGTRVWKEFKVGGKRVETRLYMKADDGTWRRTTYRWNDTETDAVRKDSGEQIPQPGKPSYEIPAVGFCDECHQGRADALLGLEPVSLGLPTATGVTLASLVAGGFLSNPPGQTSLTIPEDPAVPGKAPPALGWLHVNCGVCHNANANATAVYTNLFFLIKASQLFADGGVANATGLDAYTKAVCVKSADRDIPDGGGAKWTFVNGGSPETSLVSVLSNQRAVPPDFPTTANQMPPIITHQQDVVGHALLEDWIRALPACL